MKLSLTTILLTSLTLTLVAAEDSPFKTPEDKVSYMLGMNMGHSMKQSGVEVNPEMYLKGLKDALSGGKTLMTDEEARNTMRTFQTELREKQTAKRKAEASENLKEAETFLAANKKKEGVQVTPSGLQYKVITMGTGPKPTTNDTVIVHYRGTLSNGTEFDSSYRRGEPATFPVTGVIKGWTEALLMMPVGSKWQLVIPPDLAYGPNGRPNIPGNSVLLFDIELLGIKPPAAPKEPAKK